MQTFLMSFLLILLIGCSPKTEFQKMTPDNPFNVSLNNPIDYAGVTGDNIDEYVVKEGLLRS